MREFMIFEAWSLSSFLLRNFLRAGRGLLLYSEEQR